MNSIVIVLIAAFIGWITNFIAIRMLFRPRKRVQFGPFSLYGLIPRRQAEIAKSVGEAVADELIRHEDITEILTKPKVQAEVNLLLNQEVDSFIQQMTSTNPMVAMVLQGDLLDQVRGIIKEQLSRQLPKLFGHIIGTLEEEVDFKLIVEQRVLSLELERLEKLIYRVASKELRTIELLGGILGALVGLIQLSLI